MYPMTDALSRLPCQTPALPLDGLRCVCITIGCKLNFAETAAVAERLAQLGMLAGHKGEAADVCIVNTCAVTVEAERKCRQAIHRLRRQYPRALMVVMGCYAQLQEKCPDTFPPDCLIIPNNRKGQAVDVILERLGRSLPHPVSAETTAHFAPACAHGNRTRWWLKVQDGCDYWCSYCTIPAARGCSRNPSIDSLVEQAEGAARAGAQEVVLTGVNIGDFGRSTGERFIDLLRKLDAVTGIARYRISSIEPNLLTDEVIGFVAESRAFMPHFHVPLQAGSDEVLRLMHRRYDTAFFRSKMERIKETLPDAFIGVDVMAGMRGETDILFRQCFDFLSELPVSQLHVFPYSERPGTAALRIEHSVAPAEKHRRVSRLIALSEAKRRAFYRQFTGTLRPVLLEHAPEGETPRGFTDNYLRVEIACDPSRAGSIVEVRLGELNEAGDALRGEAVNE